MATITAVDFNNINQEYLTNSLPIIESFGITPVQAINLFFKQISEKGELPLSLNYQPNESTAKAIYDLENNQDVHTFENADDLMEWLNAD